MADAAIAIHPCGYRDAWEICPATKARVSMAFRIAAGYNISDVIITGGVYYDKKIDGSQMLAHLVQNCLQNISYGFNKEINFYLQTDCYNSSTDVQAILSEAKKQNFQAIIAVSSFWHHWFLKPFYRYWAKKLGFQGNISFVSPEKDAAGWKTKIVYFCYVTAVRGAMLLGLFSLFDRWLNDLQKNRINCFPVSGCD